MRQLVDPILISVVRVAGRSVTLGDEPFCPVPENLPESDPAALVNGDEICAEGYIMDNFCLDLGTLFDNPTVVTLARAGASLSPLPGGPGLLLYFPIRHFERQG